MVAEMGAMMAELDLNNHVWGFADASGRTQQYDTYIIGVQKKWVSGTLPKVQKIQLHFL